MIGVRRTTIEDEVSRIEHMIIHGLDAESVGISIDRYDAQALLAILEDWRALRVIGLNRGQTAEQQPLAEHVKLAQSLLIGAGQSVP